MTVNNAETGYLIEAFDTDRFAEKLLDLATNPSLAERMGRAGHRRARELFSYERHNQILQEALVNAVQTSARAMIVDKPPAVGPEVAAARKLVFSKDLEGNA